MSGRKGANASDLPSDRNTGHHPLMARVGSAICDPLLNTLKVSMDNPEELRPRFERGFYFDGLISSSSCNFPSPLESKLLKRFVSAETFRPLGFPMNSSSVSTPSPSASRRFRN